MYKYTANMFPSRPPEKLPRFTLWECFVVKGGYRSGVRSEASIFARKIFRSVEEVVKSETLTSKTLFRSEVSK